MAAEPVSRIRRAALQKNKLFEISSREVSMMLFGQRRQVLRHTGVATERCWSLRLATRSCAVGANAGALNLLKADLSF
jgi:hypothetical protein